MGKLIQLLIVSIVPFVITACSGMGAIPTPETPAAIATPAGHKPAMVLNLDSAVDRLLPIERY